MDGRRDEEISQREGEELGRSSTGEEGVTVGGGGAGQAHPSIPGTKSTLVLVTPQADAIYNMIGYPKFIMDPKELDKVFNDVSWSDTSPGSPVPPSAGVCRTCAHHHGLRVSLKP